MKALITHQFGGAEHQELVEMPVPEPGDGQLLVRVHATGINPADWKLREGRFGTSRPLPTVLGLECAGTVVALGPGVTGFSIGDAVVGNAARGHGTFAEYTVMEAGQVAVKPPHVSFEDAATMPVAGATAFDAFSMLDLEPGHTLVVLGASGGVGHLVAQIAGTHKVVTLGVASPRNQPIVESTGATFVPRGNNLAEDVKRAAAGPIHGLVDAAGGDALRALAPLVKDPTNVVSAADPQTLDEVGGSPLVRTGDGLQKVLNLLEFHLISPTITARYSLDEAALALAQVEEGHASGKVVLDLQVEDNAL